MEAVEEEEDEEESLEPDSDCTAENKSCINWPSACPTSCVELVDEVDEVDEVEPVDEEVELELASVGGPLGGEGIEYPIWLNACITLCINEDPSPESDPLLEL